MFINFSNHPSSKWSDEQLKAAKEYGEIKDMPFPPVPADAGTEDVKNMAADIVQKIIAEKPEAVMCQGEFTLTNYVTQALTACGINVLVACSERDTVENVNEKGETVKTNIYRFRQFRIV